MRRCSPIPPVVPPVSRFPRCVKPRKSVITVNGLSPDANGNVNAGDVRREDFSGVEPKEKMTLNEVGAKVNEVIGRLGGAADAAAESPSASGYGPGTPLGDVHPDTALRDVVEAAGMSADDVRAIASEVVSPIKTSVTNLQTSKLDRSDVVDPSAATEAGKAADAKKTQEELNRISGAASDAMALAESKADKATTLAGYGITDAATKVELASKADLVGGKIPSSQLPSFVDDVLEYDAMSDFPAVGEDGKIYISKDTNLTYRWGGTQYVEISQSLALGETASTAYPGDKGKATTETAISAYDAARSAADKITNHIEAKDNPHAVTAEQAGAVPLVKDTAGAKTAVTIGSRKSGELVGYYSLANGNDVTASVLASHAEGDSTTASGIFSHAEGYYTTASADYSHAEGYSTTASADYSHAEGYSTTASGYYSHAEGNFTTASGFGSHAEGFYAHTKEQDQYAFAWNGDETKTEETPYTSHGPGTFNINPVGGLNGFWIGEQTLYTILTNKADKADISATDPAFSNAVLAVGLNIDTNSVAVLNDIAATFGGFPLGAGETATTVGGLLAALAAAIAWLKKNKVGSFASVGGASATVENGVAKLDDFFTGSNSLLTGTIDARLPYPLNAVTDETGLLKDRAINTTSLASVTVPDNFTDLLVHVSVASSLAVTMPEAIATKYGDTFPGEAGEYLITITKTGAAEAYVRTIKLEEVA